LQLQETAVTPPQSSTVGLDKEFSLILALLLDGTSSGPPLCDRILNEDSISNFHPVGLGSTVHASLTCLLKVAVNFIESALDGFLMLGLVSMTRCRDSIPQHLSKEDFGWRKT
jgi:hypothetical protein